jgi:hypothetical protein
MTAVVSIHRMRRLRIRTPIFAMLFAFSFTRYVQRQSVSVAAQAALYPVISGSICYWFPVGR